MIRLFQWSKIVWLAVNIPSDEINNLETDAKIQSLYCNYQIMLSIDI
jgi:hypothetical protein